jgi:ABC-2 type transport system ATP-binding protein
MTSQAPNLVEACGLMRRYGPVTAVSEVDLTLAPGEILGLLGPNGAGKTTTLRMLAGCLAPTAGEIRINGTDIASDPADAKAHLGYLPERPPLHPEMTVDEYLGFCARLRGMEGVRRREALETVKRDCGLQDSGRRLIGNLSKGYQQRVGIAQAIVHRPAVVILDEPTVGLDPNQMRDIRALIRRLGDRHSVLISSHILSEIQATCSRVVIINGGRVVFDQAMAGVDRALDHQTVRAGFDRGPDQAALLAVDGVLEAIALNDGHWQLRCRPGNAPRRNIARASAAGGWELFELTEQTARLEDVFAELTVAPVAREDSAA